MKPLLLLEEERFDGDVNTRFEDEDELLLLDTLVRDPLAAEPLPVVELSLLNEDDERRPAPDEIAD